MTPLHHEHAVVVALSNAWHERDPLLWYVGLELSKALDRTLLACIYARLREVRDDVAREAFARRVSIGEVARERLAAVRETKEVERNPSQVPAIVGEKMSLGGADGISGPS